MKKTRTWLNKEIGLRVYRGNELHFNDYLRREIGAGWYFIRNMMYEFGCGAGEVYEYREALLRDFRRLCRENGYLPVIYK